MRGRRRREKGSIFGVSEANAGGRQSKDSWLDQWVEMGCGCGDCFSQPVCVRER